MSALLIKSNSSKTKKWSGGDTTELFISPKGSSYLNRDFDYRISTATVEVEKSVFTSLNHVSRILMVLEGKMKLTHNGEHESVLGPFDSDHFEGSWETLSEGTCIDFNLMLRNGKKGEVGVLEIEDEALSYDFYEPVMLFLYLYKGDALAFLNEEEYRLSEGDLLQMDGSDPFNFSLRSLGGATFVLVKVY